MGGYNQRIDYKGETYIVQTQDKGPAQPYVESLIYRSGRLLTARRTSYAAALGRADEAARIARLMEDQHKAILGQIVEGGFD